MESRLSLGALLMGLLAPTSFALPAWAASAAKVFSELAPLSWVVAGFVGLLTYVLCVALYGFGRGRIVRARYDARFLSETGGVDPLSKVFEGKRIFLNDFILPSNPVVTEKTFVDCEIVGPANIFLAVGNRIDDIQSDKVDAVALSQDAQFLNGFVFNNCTFRGCTFHRITIFFHSTEVAINSHLNWLNWISEMPVQTDLPLGDNDVPNVEPFPPPQSDDPGAR